MINIPYNLLSHYLLAWGNEYFNLGNLGNLWNFLVTEKLRKNFFFRGGLHNVYTLESKDKQWYKGEWNLPLHVSSSVSVSSKSKHLSICRIKPQIRKQITMYEFHFLQQNPELSKKVLHSLLHLLKFPLYFSKQVYEFSLKWVTQRKYFYV